MENNMDNLLINAFLDLEKFITKKSEYDYLTYIRYNNDMKRCEAFDNYGILKTYSIDLNTSSFLFTYDRKAKELKKTTDDILFPTSMFAFSTEAPIIMQSKISIKQALEHIKNTKTKNISICSSIKVKRTALRKILKDINLDQSRDSLTIKFNNNIIIINDRYFIHGYINN